MFYACICSKQCNVNPSVFEEVVQKHSKYNTSDMLCCERAANSGVFASLAFLVLANTM